MARPKGSLNKATREGRDFCRLILESESYKLSLVRRIANDTLPPAIELAIWHYRFGKPKDEVNVAFHDPFDDYTDEDIEQRAEKLLADVREHKRRAKALPEPPDIDTDELDDADESTDDDVVIDETTDVEDDITH